MRKFRWWAAGVLAVGVWATAARSEDEKTKAHEEEMVAESGAIEIVLLRQESVQKDIGLPGADATKIHEFASRQWKKAREIHKLPAKEQEAKYDQLVKENERFLSELLTPPQKKRLDQIGMQVAGLVWMGRPDVQAALNLTPDQKQKLKDLHKEAHKEVRAIHKLEKNDERAAEIKKHHEVIKKRVLDLLTDEQEAKWKELTGPKFEGELHHGPAKE